VAARWAAAWSAAAASGPTTNGVLELEKLVAVDEGGGVGRRAVVGTAPGHEVQLAGRPGPPSLSEGLQQPADRLGREGAGEELRLRVETLCLG
jgi:hypothetical protein